MKITLKKLHDIEACGPAIELVKKQLPLTFHVDAEKNTQTAIRLINCYCYGTNVRSLFDDLNWFLYETRSRQRFNMHVVWATTTISPCNEDLDPLVIAQVLSWIADEAPDLLLIEPCGERSSY